MRPYVSGSKMSLSRRLMGTRLRCRCSRVDTVTRTLSAVRTPVAVATTCILALAAPSALAQPATGELDFRRVLDLSRGPYIEGSVGFVQVRDARGSVVLEERVTLRARWRVRRRLPEGRYRVTSFERPCDGNCSMLDFPRERCSRRIRILAGGRTGVRVTVRPHRGCRMRARARPGALPAPRRACARPGASSAGGPGSSRGR